MSGEFELQAESRQQSGKSPSRRLRAKEGKVPAVVYGAGKPNLHIQLEQHILKRKLENESFYSHILTLHVDGQPTKVVLKALHRHPYKPMVLHADFQRISDKDKLTMQVPLHFTGEDKAPGVKKGGLLSHLLTSVEISCLPADLPEFLEVDVSALNIDESIHLSDLKLPKGIQLVELLHQNDQAVVNIHLPRAASDENAEAAPVVTEVITEKKKD